MGRGVRGGNRNWRLARDGPSAASGSRATPFDPAPGSPCSTARCTCIAPTACVASHDLPPSDEQQLAHPLRSPPVIAVGRSLEVAPQMGTAQPMLSLGGAQQCPQAFVDDDPSVSRDDADDRANRRAFHESFRRAASVLPCSDKVRGRPSRLRAELRGKKLLKLIAWEG